MPSRIDLSLNADPTEVLDLRFDTLIELKLASSPRLDLFLIHDPILHFVMEG